MWVQFFAIFAAAAPLMGASTSAPPARPLSLTGTWVMQEAYEIHADGSRTTIYGVHPSGLMMVDPQGRYSIQIYRPGRPAFRSGDKARARRKNIARRCSARAPISAA